MHVISRRPLKEFWQRHPDANASLRAWLQVAEKANWRRFADVRRSYSTADQVGKFTVFNIARNKYGLVAIIHYNRGKVFVRHVLTHAEYDRGKWKQ